jgi:hypothetical protein
MALMKFYFCLVFSIKKFYLMWLGIICAIQFLNFSILITSRGYLSANIHMSFLTWVAEQQGD